MVLNEHKPAIVGEAMGRDDSACERDTAEGLDGICV